MNSPFGGDPVDCAFQIRQGPILASHLLDAYERGFDKGREMEGDTTPAVAYERGRIDAKREYDADQAEIYRLRGIENRLEEKLRSVSGNPDSLYTSAKKTCEMLRYIQTGEAK